ncbi:hypothetical protein PG989_011757 [Apiospora arundinis]
MPEGTSIPAPSDDLDLTSVPEANLVNKQDPVAGTKENQPPMDLTTIAVPSSDFMENLDHYLEQVKNAIHSIDQLKKAHRNGNGPVGLMINDPRSPRNTMNAPLDTNPHETRLRSTELRDAKKEIRGDQKRIEEQDASSEKDKHTTQELKATIKKLRQRWQEAVTFPQKAKPNPLFSFALSEDIGDNDVMGPFTILKTRIEILADGCSSGGRKKKTAKAEFKVLFDRITPNWAEGYLGQRRCKKYFIEAVIWHKLMDAFLSHPLTILSKDMVLKTRDAGKLQSYHSARLQMAELHLQVHGRNGRYLGEKKTAMENRARLVTDLTEMLRTYTDNISKHQEKFRDIVDEAVNLAYFMAMAKAHYAIRMGTALHVDNVHGFAFKPRSMRSIAAHVPGDKVVDLVVSPALVKSGTSEGVDYDKSLNILEKARVFCEGHAGAESDTE